MKLDAGRGEWREMVSAPCGYIAAVVVENMIKVNSNDNDHKWVSLVECLVAAEPFL